MNEDRYSVLVLVAWLMVLLALVALAWKGRRPVVGLVIAYWFQLWLLHWVGGMISALSFYEGPDREATLVGFTITGYAIVGLLVGNLIPVLLLGPPASPVSTRLTGLTRPGLVCIAVGLGLYFVAARVLPRFPGSDALTSNGFSLALAGFCLTWFFLWRTGRKMAAWQVLACSAVVPFLTVILSGFLGFGVSFLINLGSFIAVFYRPRWQMALFGPLFLILGLSLYPTYMSVRGSIRQAVWGEASYSERLGRMALLMTDYQGLDLENAEHLKDINDRINQNCLVGRAAGRLDSGQVEYGRGETLGNALLALVPRALWPEKPVYAGSGGLVTRFTGVTFASGTSVGIGQVMELYVNFGRPGVLLGYVALGALLGFLDIRCGSCLLAGDWKQFTVLYMIGVAFLGVTGNFAEATAAAAGATVLCFLFFSFLPERPGGEAAAAGRGPLT